MIPTVTARRFPSWHPRGLFAICSLATFAACPAFSQEDTDPGDGFTTLGGSDSRVSVSDLIEREISEDFQLVVEGEDSLARSMFSAFSRDIRREFRNKLQLRDTDWTIPIHVQLSGSSREVVSGRYLATEVALFASNRFSITLHVKLHDRFEEEEYVNELLRVLLLDQILQPHTKDPGTIADREITVPAWLTHGFSQSIAHKRIGSPSSYYAGFLKSEQMLGTDQIFSVENPDDLNPVSLAIFRASSSALVETLLDQPGGHLTLRKVLADLAIQDSPNMDALLLQHFPGFRELENGVEKWWALQLATLAQQQSFEFLNPEETEARLNRALTVIFEEKSPNAVENPNQKKSLLERLNLKGNRNQEDSPAPFNGNLNQFESFLDRKDLREGLLRNHNELQTLLAYGFPLYRTVLARYLDILERIADRKTNGVPEELMELEALRTKIRETMIRTRDYLNYYEATAAPEKSEAFENYMRLRRELENAPPPHRNDPVSNYLDDLELEFR